MATATVIAITGQAWARDEAGNLRELRIGDTLQEGETLITSSDGRVELDFADGTGANVVEGGQEVAVSADLVSDLIIATEDASVQDDDLDALLAALEDGEGDLLDLFDATAAGGGAGGGGGGSDFVRVARIAEETDPLSFTTEGGLEGAEFVEFDGGAAAATADEEIDGNPTADSASIMLDERQLVFGEQPQLSQPQFNSVTASGSINFSFGPLGAGSIGFASMDGQTLSIGQESFNLDWDAASNTLTASNGRVQNSNPDEPFLFQVQIDPQTGDFTFTLANNLLHEEGADEALASLVYTVTDAAGNTASNNLDITIVDDGPGLELGTVDLSEVSLETQDSQTIDGTSVATGSVAAAFSDAVTAQYGADGAGSTAISGYALTLSDIDHGLESNGEPITFTLAEGVITGSTAAGEVLRLEMDSDGNVTVTQSAALDHAEQGADSLSLPAGLVGVEATVTVTDGDGDTVTETLSADLGDSISIVDDMPSIVEDTVDLSEVSLATQDSQTIDGTSVATGSVAAAFSDAVTAQYGADGAGSTAISGYALTLSDIDHGLESNGEPITFTLAEGVITGSTAAGEVLRLEVDSDGNVTVTQSAALDHAEQGADSLTLPPGLVGVDATVTVTDGDGDTVTETLSADLGDSISIVDDMPSIVEDTVDLSEVSLATQDSQTIDGTSVATGSVAAAFSDAVTAQYGADGEGSTAISGYTLTLSDIDHGLESNGEPITFTLAEGVITGSTAAGEVLRLEVDSDGNVTVTQSAALDHAEQGADSLTLPEGLVGVDATVTVTDGDGDTVTETLSADLGDSISIVDDMPSIVEDTVDLSEVSLATQDSQTIDGTSVATGSVAAAFSDAVTAQYGADGAGSTAISGYALTLSDIDHGLESNGEPITFTLAEGVITGSTAAGEVLRLEVDSDGNVTVTQSAALDHAEQGADSLTLPEGLVGVDATVTVTDGDGDTVTETRSADLGDSISIVDDMPVALDDVDIVATGTAEGNVITAEGTLNEAGADDFGADGTGKVTSVSFGETTVNVPTNGSAEIDGEFGTLTLNADGGYTYEVDPDKLPQNTKTIAGWEKTDSNMTAFKLGESFLTDDGKYSDATGNGTITSGGNASGFGVRGIAEGPSNSAPNQINYSGSLSEALAFKFDGSVLSATVQFSNLYQDERGGETMRWHAFDAEGNRLESGIVSNNDASEPSVNNTDADFHGIGNNKGSFNISDIGAFSTLVFEALPYSNDGSAKADDSDFFVNISEYESFDQADNSYQDQFGYTIVDGDGDSASATLTLNGDAEAVQGELTPLAPVAVGNTYQVDGEITGNIITDDDDNGGAASGRDYDNDTPVLNLSIHSVIFNGVETSITENGQVFELENGTLSINLDGSYTYTPNEDANGGDVFEYTLIDPDGEVSELATVTLLAPINEAPVAKDVESSGKEDSEGISVLLSATDADGTVESFIIQSLPENGTLYNGNSLVSKGDEVAAANGEVALTFVPIEDWSNNSNDPSAGTSFGYAAKDNKGALSDTATATIDVAPVTDEPTVELTLTESNTSSMYAVDLKNVLDDADGKSGNPAGFTVTAVKNGEPGDISIKKTGSPTGFGVEGKASNGDDLEIGEGEELHIKLDTPASLVTFQLSWLNSSNETAVYTVHYADGSSSTYEIDGGNDGIEDRVTVNAPVNNTITAIEFSTPTEGPRQDTSDYLLHHVEYESAKTTYTVDITAEPTDKDFSESITSLVVKTPAGVTLSGAENQGTVNGVTTWGIALDGSGGYTNSVEIDSETRVVTVKDLKLSVPDDFTGELIVEAIATAKDGGASSAASGSATETLTIDAVDGGTPEPTEPEQLVAVDNVATAGLSVIEGTLQLGDPTDIVGKNFDTGIVSGGSDSEPGTTSHEFTVNNRLAGQKIDFEYELDVNGAHPKNGPGEATLKWELFKEGVFEPVLDGEFTRDEEGITCEKETLSLDGIAPGKYTLKLSGETITDTGNQSVSVNAAIVSLTLATTTASSVDELFTAEGNVITDNAEINGTGNADAIGNLNYTLNIENNNNEYVEVDSNGTNIEGKYGHLQIFADGSYTYTPNGDSSDVGNIGKTDSFNYQLKAEDGRTSEASLDIKIGHYEVGTDGNDTLQATNDHLNILVGGEGDDILIGLDGAQDIFVWNDGDQGEQNPVKDYVQNFNTEDGDMLDLSDLLQGEDNTNINEYVIAEEDGAGNVVLNISAQGSASGADQKITLEGKSFNDFGSGVSSGEDLIAKLIADGQLKIDQ